MRIGPSLLLKKDISMRQTLLSIAIVLTGLSASNAWAFADDDARKAILELRQQLAASQRSPDGNDLPIGAVAFSKPTINGRH